MFKKRTKKIGEGVDGVDGAKKTALSLLAYKENTEKELYEKLIDRGYAEEEAAEALDYVVSKKYLDEARYFTRFVENCANIRLYGKKRILREAYVKKFSRATVDRLAESLFDAIDFNENCARALSRLSCDDKQKAVAALLRRGYSGENIRYAFKKE